MKLLILLTSLIVFSSCSDTIKSTTVIDGFEYSVSLTNNGTMPNEYSKVLEIKKGNFSLKTDLGIDTGGYPWVSIYKINSKDILIRDFFGNDKVFKASEKKISTFDSTVKTDEQYLGNFNFDKSKNYRFIPKKESATDPSKKDYGG